MDEFGRQWVKSFEISLEERVAEQVNVRQRRIGTSKPPLRFGVALGFLFGTSLTQLVSIVAPKSSVIGKALKDRPVAFLAFNVLACTWICMSIRWRYSPKQILANGRRLFGDGPFVERIELLEAVISDTTDGIECRFPWTSITSVNLDRGAIELFGQFFLIRIPARAFEDDKERNAWIRQIEVFSGQTFTDNAR